MNDTSPRPSLSGGMIAVGILLILWGLLMGCGSSIGLIGLVAVKSMDIQGDPDIDLMRNNQLVFAFGAFEIVARLVLSIVGIACGAGLLMRARWSVLTGYIFAAGSLFVTLVGMVAFFVWLMPARLEAAEQMNSQMQMQIKAQTFGQIGGMFCCGMLLPLGLFFFLRSDHVAEQVGDFEDDDDRVGEVFE